MSNIIKWKVNENNGCVEYLYIGNKRIAILGWGTETSDRYSFFSQDLLGGRNCQILYKKIERGDTYINSKFIIKLKKITLDINCDDELLNSQIRRIYKLRALEQGYLADFVIRAVFSKDFIKHMIIDRKIFSHQCSNIYRQYPLTLVNARSNIGMITFQLENWSQDKRFDILSYIRDEPQDKWVIHHRLLANKSQLLLLQLYKLTISQKYCPLLKTPFFRDKFWLYSEVRNNKLPFTFQVGSYSKLEEGEELMMVSKIIFEDS